MNKPQICNMALARFGDKSRRVTSIDTPTTTVEQVCADLYEPSRLLAIARFDWPCFRKVFQLSQSDDDPALTGWSYKYARPPDCLIFRRIVDTNETSCDFKEFTEWDTDTAKNVHFIYSNLDDAYGVYSYDNQDPASYSPGFVWLHAAMLAEMAAVPITGKPAIAERISLEIERTIERKALAAGGVEYHIEDERGTTDWLDAISTGLST